MAVRLLTQPMMIHRADACLLLNDVGTQILRNDELMR